MENLFSYGTLQLVEVQKELFGRMVEMRPDALVGYKKEKIKIKIEPAGEEEHLIISFSGDDSDVIEGMVLSITDDELKHADEYEPIEYKRIQVALKSGVSSWVYVKNDN